MSHKPVLVGESNPYGANPDFALYPAPDGCSGHRLCCLILGMRRTDYLTSFLRVNLCDGPWDEGPARDRAEQITDGTYLEGQDEETPVILLGKKVANAFDVGFVPFHQLGEDILVLPHPSGRCQIWNRPNAIEQARGAVAKMCPWLTPLLGQVTA